MAAAQTKWAGEPVRARLRVLRRARHMMAARAGEFAAAISPQLQRTQADTLVSELLPLLDACRFLEREAERLLRPRRLGRRGRPLWLAGVTAEIHREPLGRVLVMGPANFPLLLPGVQTLQALAAGNAVVWKPGAGGRAVAELVAGCLSAAGLPERLLRVTPDTVSAGERALAAEPDKVIFTGSSLSGRAMLSVLAETGTPAVVEMSGADAMIVLDGADLRAVAKAAAFGLRLNGGAVCMSPRRLLALHAAMGRLRPLLQEELAKVPPVKVERRSFERMRGLVAEAVAEGAALLGELDGEAQRPIVVDAATASMRVTRSDVFAPVLSLIEVSSPVEIPEVYARCPYALTASIFCARGDEKRARILAGALRAGTVLINDVIAPTADPRVPFGGRGESGYGLTRGAEGLLEMTAVKVLLLRRGGSMRHFEPTRESDVPLMAGMVQAMHAGRWAERWRGVRAVMKAGRVRK
jgi:aldehyde dehydrogenase (NAD+)